MTDVIVLGAGMVGVSTGLALQAQGHAVTIVDRKAPGTETSFGNAGVIQVEAAEPYGLPRDFKTLLRIALGQTNDVFWRAKDLVSMAPALFSYFRHSRPDEHARISRIYSSLTSSATIDHAPLIEAAHAQNIVSRDGLALLFRDERAFDRAALDAERVRQTFGVTSRVLGGTEYRREESALISTPAGAIHFDQSWSCSDPGGLTEAYAHLFQSRGGRIVLGDAGSFEQNESGWRVTTEEGAVEAEQIVVALGPWSPQLLKRIGYSIPMVYKRGYHGHYRTSFTLRRPFLDAANGVVAASMRQGLRVTTGAALFAPQSEGDVRQLERGRAGLSQLLDIGPRIEEDQWFGTRPCLPDMVPMVGRAPRHKGLWFNFGHGHQGFTLGPTTARLLATAFQTGNDDVLVGLRPAERVN